MRRLLAPGSARHPSGLLASQEKRGTAAYRPHGFVLKERIHSANGLRLVLDARG